MMNIKRLLIILLFVAYFQSYSQRNNQVRFYYGLVDSKFLRNKELLCSGSYENKNSNEFGFKYLRKLSERLSIETGINIIKSDVIVTPSFTGTPVTPVLEKLNLITIPVYANYSFGKYFYFNVGPVLDFQDGEASFESQSGIGYGLGIGAKYNLKNLFIYINPDFKRHSSIPFKKYKYHQRLTQFGIQIGIGYGF